MAYAREKDFIDKDLSNYSKTGRQIYDIQRKRFKKKIKKEPKTRVVITSPPIAQISDGLQRRVSPHESSPPIAQISDGLQRRVSPHESISLGLKESLEVPNRERRLTFGGIPRRGSIVESITIGIQEGLVPNRERRKTRHQIGKSIFTLITDIPQNNFDIPATISRCQYRWRAIKYIVTEWGANTTIHGVANFFNARSKSKFIVWISLLLTAAFAPAFFLQNILSRFREFRVDRTQDFHLYKHLEFPGVTFCNNNPMRASKSDLLTPEQRVIFSRLTSNMANTTLNMSLPDRLGLREDFEWMFNTLDEETKFSVSHKIDDMLVDCLFGQEVCGINNFTHEFNPHFGNCYSFNAQNPPLLVHKAGPEYGLTMDIMLEQSEYLPGLLEGAGIRLKVHAQHENHFIEDGNIFLKPNTITLFGIRRGEVERLPPPYRSECEQLTREERSKYDMYPSLKNVTYSVKGCQKTCRQKMLLKQCGCGDPRTPRVSVVLGNENGPPIEPCTTADLVRCHHEDINNDTNECTCPNLCSETKFEYEASYGTWPTVKSEDTLINMFKQQNVRVGPELEAGLRLGIPKKNQFLRVVVYYVTFNVEHDTEVPDYPLSALIGDVGGVYGVFIGASIISLVEIFDMVLDCCHVLIGYVMKNTRIIE